MKETGIFDLLQNNTSQRFLAGIFLTYGFDAELFEHYVLPTVYGIDTNDEENLARFRRQVANCLINSPVMVIADEDSYKGGRTFMYDLFLGGEVTFHPKVFLLLYEGSLKVIIGSCNLTKGGMCYNAELLWSYELKEGDSTSLGAYIKKLLLSLNKSYKIENSESYKLIIELLNKFDESDDASLPLLVSTLNDDDILTQLTVYVSSYPSKIKRIRILSPFFESDRENAFETSFMKSFYDGMKPYMEDKCSLDFYFPGIYMENIDRWRVDVPENIFSYINSLYSNVSFNVVKPLWMTDDGEKMRPFHAKLVMLEFSDKSILHLMGSPNFTNAAMASNFKRLKNVEVGVIEHSKKQLELPEAQKVNLKQLEVSVKQDPTEAIPIVFIRKAVCHIIGKSQFLEVFVETKKVVLPFEINYGQKNILRVEGKAEEIYTIEDFKLKKEQDITVTYGDASFFIPIYVVEKYMFDLETPIILKDLNLKDIIDYYSGYFRNKEEFAIYMGKLQMAATQSPQDSINSFSQDIKGFFKAVDGLKSRFSKPFWNEDAFRFELNQDMGLKKLVELIDGELNNNKLSNQEGYFYLTEIKYAILSLKFDDDMLKAETKIGLLKEINESIDALLLSIESSCTRSVKEQFKLLKDYYEGARCCGK